MCKIRCLVSNCFSLLLFVFISIQQHMGMNDTLKWSQIPTVRPPRLQKSPRLGKRGKHYRVLIKGDYDDFRVINRKRSVRKLHHHHKPRHVNCQLWYEVGKEGKLHPIHVTNYTEWESIHPPPPTLDQSYGQWFDTMCNTYD